MVTSGQIRFYRHLAGRCRDLATVADKMSRGLSDLAEACDEKSREEERAGQTRRTDVRCSPVLAPAGSIEPLTVSIKDTAQLLGVGRSTIYRLIGEGRLQCVKIGRRALIKAASIRTLAQAQD